MRKLAIITTHPIQYNAPLFAMLTHRGNIAVKVFYTWGEEVLNDKYDPGFGQAIKWDIPLLKGYDYTFVNNIASNKGSHHFKGINNPTLVNEINEWGADAVMVYGWSFQSHLKVMRYFHGRIPVLFRGDSTLLRESSILKKSIRSIFLKWVYKHVDHVLYVGTHNKQYYREYGLKDNQMVFAPHAIDNERFEAICKQQHEVIANWRQTLHIPPDTIVLLYAGKLDENKNVHLLATVFNRLPNKKLHLLIAGNGKLEEKLKEDFGKNERVHFLPFQNQSRMPLLYGVADLFILPSLSETWGLGINEAMACHKAILASSGCAAAIDLVKDGENGYVFKNNDGDDLEEKLQMLTEDRHKLRTLGERSGEKIKTWSFLACCNRIEELVNNQYQKIKV